MVVKKAALGDRMTGGLVRERSAGASWRWSDGVFLSTVAAWLITMLILTYIQAAKQRKKHSYPPGPRPWPIVGNFPSLAGPLLHRTLQTLATKFGGFVFLRLGSVNCILISTAAVAKEIFQRHDACFSGRPMGLIHSILSNNRKNFIVAPYGPYWRHLRRITSTELFSPQRLASYKIARAEEIHSMLEVILDESRKGNPINLRKWAYSVTANNMTRMLINKRFYGNGAEHKEEREELDEMIMATARIGGAFIVSDYVPWLSFIPKLQGWPSLLRNLRDNTRSIATRLFELEKHRERARDLPMQGTMNNSDDKSSYVPDFVDVLLQAPLDDGKPLSDADLINIVMDMMIAGTDTTAVVSEWAMLELILHPLLMQRAQEEIDKVVGTDRVIEETDLPKLLFLQAFVKETLRLHPPIAVNMPREATQPATVMGYDFPARTQLIMNIYSIHRDPSVYENPHSFNPDRFLETSGGAHSRVDPTVGNDSYELAPFGMGRRMCPASNLGYTMASFMLANLLHAFDWTLPVGQSVETLDLSEVFGLSLVLKHPLVLMAKPRLPALLFSQPKATQ